MSDNHCQYCGRPKHDPDNPFCSAECQALGHLGINRDPELLIAIRRLAQYERTVLVQSAQTGAESPWVVQQRLMYPSGNDNTRMCGHCGHADKWFERGAWDLDCGLHGKVNRQGEIDGFAWRERFIDYALSDDTDALYCDRFVAAGVQP